ncbi:cysteine hydrolase family protein [Thiopseudomonas denitrificans]
MRHAHDLGYEVTIVSDAVPAFTAEQQKHVLPESTGQARHGHVYGYSRKTLLSISWCYFMI